MRALGFDVKKADIVKMVHDVDPNNSGSVDYPQFLEISRIPSCYSPLLIIFPVTDRYSERNPEEEIIKAFQVDLILTLSL
jgi:centrin-3